MKFKVGDIVVNNSKAEWDTKHRARVVEILKRDYFMLGFFEHPTVSSYLKYPMEYFELDQEALNEREMRKLLGVSDDT